MQMSTVIFLSSIGGLLFLGSCIFAFFKIRSMYRVYDFKETLKEEIMERNKLLDEAMEYFYTKYTNDFDHSIYETLRIKVGFLRDIISKRNSLEERLSYMDKLYKALYETEYRLRTNFSDVNAIIAPLNHIRDEIVHKQIEMLRNTEI